MNEHKPRVNICMSLSLDLLKFRDYVKSSTGLSSSDLYARFLVALASGSHVAGIPTVPPHPEAVRLRDGHNPTE